MADILIRFTGDASGLASFYSGVARQTDAFVGRLTKTYRSEFSNILSTPSGTAIKQFDVQNIFGKASRAGTEIRGLRYQLDQFNDVIKVTATTGLKLANGGFLPVAETNAFRGSTKALTAELIKQDSILARRVRLRSAADYVRGQYAQQAGPALQEVGVTEADRNAAAAILAQRKAERSAFTQLLSDRRAFAATLAKPLSGAAKSAFDDNTNRILEKRALAQKEVERATRALTKAQQQYDAALANPSLANYDRQLSSLSTKLNARRTQLNSALAASQAQEQAILKSPPTVPAGYQQLPPELQRILSRGGLGGGAGSLSQNLYAQEASFNAPTKDLVRNVTEFSGAFRDSQGVINRWAAELDKNGRVITRFGGNLSGISKIGSQIIRDFQKVIEWTVATTVVFGGLAAAASGLVVIKDIDANLTRFSITANLSAGEAKKFYENLVRIADVTATPLEELVKAADDLALAVKKPGQTTQQLTSDIETLAQAIGIYTNITGQDTVAATDELVAIMKQLGISAEGVYTILNKVTASAEGQSSTISDITKALSVMAEAGKQANLTIDEQIATIKVLSQVTSKSPAEIATSFKNLVGALENPAALKALKLYHIGLISEGNSIIDIYTQIAEKIRTGVIPQGQVTGLLRAISGGPRREPDAAAFLANINSVIKETGVSQNATNEAFIANAKIIDTIQAKIVRLGNNLKDAVFSKFGDTFKAALNTGLSLLTKFLDFFNKIPTGFFSAITQVVAFTVTFRVLARVFGAVISSFHLASLAEGEFTQLTLESATAQGVLAASTAKANISLLEQAAIAGKNIIGKFGGAKGLASIAAGAAVGAGLGAASGGGLPQIAGGALQGAGLIALGLPDPSLITKVAGALLLVAGGFLQIQKSGNEANDTLAESQQQILDAYQSAKEAGENLSALRKDQGTIKSEINSIENTPQRKRSLDDQAQLNDLYNQYAQNILQAADAQRQLNQALDAFSKAQSQIPGAEGYSERLKAAIIKGYDDPDVKAFIDNLQIQLLKQSFPNIQDTLDVKKFTLNANEIPQQPASPAGEQFYVTPPRPPGNGVDTRKPEFIDLANLDEKKLKDLFSLDGSKFTASMYLTRKAIDDVNTAIGQLPEDQQKKYQAAFDAFRLGKDYIDDAATALTYYKTVATNLKTLGFNDLSTQLTSVSNAAETVLQEGLKNGLSKEALRGTLNTFFADISDAANSKKLIPNNELLKLGQLYIQATIPATELTGNAEKFKALTESAASALFGWVPPLEAANKAMTTLSDESKKFYESIGSALDDALGGVAQKSQDAFGKLLNGDISAKQYAKIAAYLNQAAAAANNAKASFNRLDKSDAGAQTLAAAFRQVQREAVKLPGLQDAASLSADGFIKRLYSLADAYNLNGRGVDLLNKKIAGLFNAIQTISNARATFHLGVDVDLKALIAFYKAINKGTPIVNPITGFVTGYSGGGSYDSVIKDLINAQNNLNTFGSGLNTIYNQYGGKGPGGSGSKTPKQKPGFDVSTLDLPDEIANAANRSSLIQEAIKRARELQSKIPGATKDAKNDIVELLKGTQRILEVRGVKDDYLRKALEELAAVEKKRLEFDTKADTIRRIRVGDGSFAALANVPLNSQTGVSVGSPNGPITVNLNINGQILTPAQFAALANQIAAAINKQIAGGGG